MRAKFINEKFTEKSDPIHDMGIGYDFELKSIEQATSNWYEIKTVSPEGTTRVLKSFNSYVNTDNSDDLMFVGTRNREVFDVDQVRGKRIMYQGKIYKIPK